MKTLIIVCVLFASTFCAPTINENLNNEWTLFKQVHSKVYKSMKEEDTRRSIWEKNVAKIQLHNLEADLGIHTYTLGMNEFGDKTHEEFKKQMNGYKGASSPTEHNAASRTFKVLADFAIPDAVDWRKEGYVTPIKNQKECGSCWAFSSVGALEGQHFAKTKQLVSLSEQNLVDCSGKYGNMGCNGGWMNPSFEYIKDNKGIDTESSYPYEGRNNRCRFQKVNVGATDTGYVNVTSGSEADLQGAIAKVGPVAVAIDASQDSFMFYKNGVYNEPQCSTTELDHAVLAVGYDKAGSNEYYIVKNSWGTSWGTDGYIWMTRNGKNQCGIATAASYPLV